MKLAVFVLLSSLCMSAQDVKPPADKAAAGTTKQEAPQQARVVQGHRTVTVEHTNSLELENIGLQLTLYKGVISDSQRLQRDASQAIESARNQMTEAQRQIQELTRAYDSLLTSNCKAAGYTRENCQVSKDEKSGAWLIDFVPSQPKPDSAPAKPAAAQEPKH